MDEFYSGDALKKIIDNRINQLTSLIKENASIDELKDIIQKKEEEKLFYDFKNRIKINITSDKFKIIAEIKQIIHSAGIIIDEKDYNPVKIANIYKANKATCLSVLTEESYFNGNIKHIKQIKDAGIKLPILCKDFFVNKWQLYYAKSEGADAILIILAGIGKKLANELYDEAIKLNLSVIIETHTIEEAKYALRFNEALIGINNRNLKTLKTDINTTYNINNVLQNFAGPLICESGIKTKKELLEIEKKTRIKTFLIGESLLKNLNKNSIFTVL
jgi:indole-3-glycerol phosphate synthase